MPPKGKKQAKTPEMPPLVSASGPAVMKAAAEQLANEILHVYSAVAAVVPDVERRIGSKDPTWITLDKGGTATMRDYVLHDYARPDAASMVREAHRARIIDKAITCPLSFEIASNRRSFDIDHFHPDDTMMKQIDTLLGNDPIFLEEVRSQVGEKLTATHGKGRADEILNAMFIPIPKVAIDPPATSPEPDLDVATARDVTEMGTSAVSAAPQYDLRGLKNIYYNYPPNLWPISGPTNSAKGDQKPLQMATAMTLTSLKAYSSTDDFKGMCSRIDDELGLVPGTSEREPETAVPAVSGGFFKQFQDREVTAPHILPHILNPVSMGAGTSAGTIKPTYECELDFFKGTQLGQVATGFCEANTAAAINHVSMIREAVRSGPAAVKATGIVSDSLHTAVQSDPFSASHPSDDAHVLSLLNHTTKGILEAAGAQAKLLENRGHDVSGIRPHIVDALASVDKAQSGLEYIPAPLPTFTPGVDTTVDGSGPPPFSGHFGAVEDPSVSQHGTSVTVASTMATPMPGPPVASLGQLGSSGASHLQPLPSFPSSLDTLITIDPPAPPPKPHGQKRVASGPPDASDASDNSGDETNSDEEKEASLPSRLE